MYKFEEDIILYLTEEDVRKIVTNMYKGNSESIKSCELDYFYGLSDKTEYDKITLAESDYIKLITNLGKSACCDKCNCEEKGYECNCEKCWATLLNKFIKV